jgi:signal transduction histidine kinase
LIEIKQAHILQFLYQAASTLSTELSTDEVLQRLMRLTHQHFSPDAVSVALVAKDGGLVFQAASGKSAQQIIGMRLPPGTGIVGWVAQHGNSLWVPNVYQDRRFYPDADKQTGFHTTAILAAPVKLGEEVLAVVEMINPSANTNLDEAEQVLSALASLAAPAIQNSILFEQAQRAEARYASLLAQNLDPIVTIDHQGNPLEINQATKKLLKLAPDAAGFTLELLGFSFTQFNDFKERLASGEIINWEFNTQGAEPERRLLEVYLSYLPDYPPNGAYQWIAHDITDRVALEEMRQNLSNMIVHDLRAPLGSVLNSLELMLTAWRDKDITIPIEQVLRIGLRSAHRMERLISTILDTARLQANEKTLSITEITIPELIEEVLEVIRSSAERRSHQLITNIAPDILQMRGDIDLLRRVLINITSNAVKYIPDGGTIEVTVSSDEEQTLFSVADDGPGIPPDEAPHIFELFFRGKAPKAKGSGLGLAFCKLAVEAHNGRIWLDTELGKGTTFYLTIPHNVSESTMQERR